MAAATTRSGRKLPSIRTLWAIAKSPELGLTDEDLHGVVYRETGKGSMKQLTQGEITAVARVLQNMKDSAARGSRSKRTDEGFVKRMTGIDRLEWLDAGQCEKIIEGLKAILAREQRKEGADGRRNE
mgnify:CR=1 FL=1